MSLSGPHASDVAAGQEPDTLASRQCGRCRGFFDGDPTLDPTVPPDWWVCPPCRTVLFGFAV
jgi:hypothetical protein